MAKRNTTNTASTETQPSTEERVAALKEKLQQGLARIESDEDWRKHLTRFGKMGPQSPLRYSFNNQVLLMVQADERAEAGAPIDLSAVATFDGWKQVGRLVRKGEKALWILRPNVCKDWKKINAAKAEGRTMSPEEMAKATFVIYGMMPVFSVTQTDGEPLEVTRVPDLASADEWEAACAAMRQVALADGVPSMDFRSRLPGDPFSTAAGWCYSQTTRAIVVITDGQTRAEQLATAAHELAHAMLHGDAQHDKAFKEVEAESVSFIVCGALGLDTSKFSFGYVQNWAASGALEPAKQVEASGKRIAQTACKILDAMAGVRRDSGEAQEYKAAA